MISDDGDHDEDSCENEPNTSNDTNYSGQDPLCCDSPFQVSIKTEPFILDAEECYFAHGEGEEEEPPENNLPSRPFYSEVLVKEEFIPPEEPDGVMLNSAANFEEYEVSGSDLSSLGDLMCCEAILDGFEEESDDMCARQSNLQLDHSYSQSTPHHENWTELDSDEFEDVADENHAEGNSTTTYSAEDVADENHAEENSTTTYSAEVPESCLNDPSFSVGEVSIDSNCNSTSVYDDIINSLLCLPIVKNDQKQHKPSILRKNRSVALRKMIKRDKFIVAPVFKTIETEPSGAIHERTEDHDEINVGSPADLKDDAKSSVDVKVEVNVDQQSSDWRKVFKRVQRRRNQWRGGRRKKRKKDSPAAKNQAQSKVNKKTSQKNKSAKPTSQKFEGRLTRNRNSRENKDFMDTAVGAESLADSQSAKLTSQKSEGRSTRNYNSRGCKDFMDTAVGAEFLADSNSQNCDVESLLYDLKTHNESILDSHAVYYRKLIDTCNKCGLSLSLKPRLLAKDFLNSSLHNLNCFFCCNYYPANDKTSFKRHLGSHILSFLFNCCNQGLGFSLSLNYKVQHLLEKYSSEAKRVTDSEKMIVPNLRVAKKHSSKFNSKCSASKQNQSEIENFMPPLNEVSVSNSNLETPLIEFSAVNGEFPLQDYDLPSFKKLESNKRSQHYSPEIFETFSLTSKHWESNFEQASVSCSNFNASEIQKSVSSQNINSMPTMNCPDLFDLPESIEDSNHSSVDLQDHSLVASSGKPIVSIKNIDAKFTAVSDLKPRYFVKLNLESSPIKERPKLKGNKLYDLSEDEILEHQLRIKYDCLRVPRVVLTRLSDHYIETACNPSSGCKTTESSAKSTDLIERIDACTWKFQVQCELEKFRNLNDETKDSDACSFEQCQKCDRSFIKHSKIDSISRFGFLYPCGSCFWHFGDKSWFLRHVKHFHPFTGPFICHLCNQECKFWFQFVFHVKLHDINRSLCEKCSISVNYSVSAFSHDDLIRCANTYYDFKRSIKVWPSLKISKHQRPSQSIDRMPAPSVDDILKIIGVEPEPDNESVAVSNVSAEEVASSAANLKYSNFKRRSIMESLREDEWNKLFEEDQESSKHVRAKRGRKPKNRRFNFQKSENSMTLQVNENSNEISSSNDVSSLEEQTNRSIVQTVGGPENLVTFIHGRRGFTKPGPKSWKEEKKLDSLSKSNDIVGNEIDEVEESLHGFHICADNVDSSVHQTNRDLFDSCQLPSSQIESSEESCIPSESLPCISIKNDATDNVAPIDRNELKIVRSVRSKSKRRRRRKAPKSKAICRNEATRTGCSKNKLKSSSSAEENVGKLSSASIMSKTDLPHCEEYVETLSLSSLLDYDDDDYNMGSSDLLNSLNHCKQILDEDVSGVDNSNLFGSRTEFPEKLETVSNETLSKEEGKVADPMHGLNFLSGIASFCSDDVDENEAPSAAELSEIAASLNSVLENVCLTIDANGSIHSTPLNSALENVCLTINADGSIHSTLLNSVLDPAVKTFENFDSAYPSIKLVSSSQDNFVTHNNVDRSEASNSFVMGNTPNTVNCSEIRELKCPEEITANHQFPCNSNSNSYMTGSKEINYVPPSIALVSDSHEYFTTSNDFERNGAQNSSLVLNPPNHLGCPTIKDVEELDSVQNSGLSVNTIGSLPEHSPNEDEDPNQIDELHSHNLDLEADEEVKLLNTPVANWHLIAPEDKSENNRNIHQENSVVSSRLIATDDESENDGGASPVIGYQTLDGNSLNDENLANFESSANQFKISHPKIFKPKILISDSMPLKRSSMACPIDPESILNFRKAVFKGMHWKWRYIPPDLMDDNDGQTGNLSSSNVNSSDGKYVGISENFRNTTDIHDFTASNISEPFLENSCFEKSGDFVDKDGKCNKTEKDPLEPKPIRNLPFMKLTGSNFKIIGSKKEDGNHLHSLNHTDLNDSPTKVQLESKLSAPTLEAECLKNVTPTLCIEDDHNESFENVSSSSFSKTTNENSNTQSCFANADQSIKKVNHCYKSAGNLIPEVPSKPFNESAGSEEEITTYEDLPVQKSSKPAGNLSNSMKSVETIKKSNDKHFTGADIRNESVENLSLQKSSDPVHNSSDLGTFSGSVDKSLDKLTKVIDDYNQLIKKLSAQKPFEPSDNSSNLIKSTDTIKKSHDELLSVAGNHDDSVKNLAKQKSPEPIHSSPDVVESSEYFKQSIDNIKKVVENYNQSVVDLPVPKSFPLIDNSLDLIRSDERIESIDKLSNLVNNHNKSDENMSVQTSCDQIDNSSNLISVHETVNTFNNKIATVSDNYNKLDENLSKQTSCEPTDNSSDPISTEESVIQSNNKRMKETDDNVQSSKNLAELKSCDLTDNCSGLMKSSESVNKPNDEFSQLVDNFNQSVENLSFGNLSEEVVVNLSHENTSKIINKPAEIPLSGADNFHQSVISISLSSPNSKHTFLKFEGNSNVDKCMERVESQDPTVEDLSVPKSKSSHENGSSESTGDYKSKINGLPENYHQSVEDLSTAKPSLQSGEISVAEKLNENISKIMGETGTCDKALEKICSENSVKILNENCSLKRDDECINKFCAEACCDEPVDLSTTKLSNNNEITVKTNEKVESSTKIAGNVFEDTSFHLSTTKSSNNNEIIVKTDKNVESSVIVAGNVLEDTSFDLSNTSSVPNQSCNISNPELSNHSLVEMEVGRPENAALDLFAAESSVSVQRNVELDQNSFACKTKTARNPRVQKSPMANSKTKNFKSESVQSVDSKIKSRNAISHSPGKKAEGVRTKRRKAKSSKINALSTALQEVSQIISSLLHNDGSNDETGQSINHFDEEKLYYENFTEIAESKGSSEKPIQNNKKLHTGEDEYFSRASMNVNSENNDSIDSDETISADTPMHDQRKQLKSLFSLTNPKEIKTEISAQILSKRKYLCKGVKKRQLHTYRKKAIRGARKLHGDNIPECEISSSKLSDSTNKVNVEGFNEQSDETLNQVESDTDSVNYNLRLSAHPSRIYPSLKNPIRRQTTVGKFSTKSRNAQDSEPKISRKGKLMYRSNKTAPLQKQSSHKNIPSSSKAGRPSSHNFSSQGKETCMDRRRKKLGKRSQVLRNISSGDEIETKKAQNPSVYDFDPSSECEKSLLNHSVEIRPKVKTKASPILKSKHAGKRGRPAADRKFQSQRKLRLKKSDLSEAIKKLRPRSNHSPLNCSTVQLTLKSPSVPRNKRQSIVPQPTSDNKPENYDTSISVPVSNFKCKNFNTPTTQNMTENNYAGSAPSSELEAIATESVVNNLTSSVTYRKKRRKRNSKRMLFSHHKKRKAPVSEPTALQSSESIDKCSVPPEIKDDDNGYCHLSKAEKDKPGKPEATFKCRKRFRRRKKTRFTAQKKRGQYVPKRISVIAPETEQNHEERTEIVAESSADLNEEKNEKSVTPSTTIPVTYRKKRRKRNSKRMLFSHHKKHVASVSKPAPLKISEPNDKFSVPPKLRDNENESCDLSKAENNDAEKSETSSKCKKRFRRRKKVRFTVQKKRGQYVPKRISVITPETEQNLGESIEIVAESSANSNVEKSGKSEIPSTTISSTPINNYREGKTSRANRGSRLTELCLMIRVPGLPRKPKAQSTDSNPSTSTATLNNNSNSSSKVRRGRPAQLKICRKTRKNKSLKINQIRSAKNAATRTTSLDVKPIDVKSDSTTTETSSQSEANQDPKLDMDNVTSSFRTHSVSNKLARKKRRCKSHTRHLVLRKTPRKYLKCIRELVSRSPAIPLEKLGNSEELNEKSAGGTLTTQNIDKHLENEFTESIDEPCQQTSESTRNGTVGNIVNSEESSTELLSFETDVKSENDPTSILLREAASETPKKSKLRMIRKRKRTVNMATSDPNSTSKKIPSTKLKTLRSVTLAASNSHPNSSARDNKDSKSIGSIALSKTPSTKLGLTSDCENSSVALASAKKKTLKFNRSSKKLSCDKERGKNSESDFSESVNPLINVEKPVSKNSKKCPKEKSSKSDIFTDHDPLTSRKRKQRVSKITKNVRKCTKSPKLSFSSSRINSDCSLSSLDSLPVKCKSVIKPDDSVLVKTESDKVVTSFFLKNLPTLKPDLSQTSSVFQESQTENNAEYDSKLDGTKEYIPQNVESSNEKYFSEPVGTIEEKKMEKPRKVSSPMIKNVDLPSETQEHNFIFSDSQKSRSSSASDNQKFVVDPSLSASDNSQRSEQLFEEKSFPELRYSPTQELEESGSLEVAPELSSCELSFKIETTPSKANNHPTEEEAINSVRDSVTSSSPSVTVKKQRVVDVKQSEEEASKVDTPKNNLVITHQESLTPNKILKLLSENMSPESNRVVESPTGIASKNAINKDSACMRINVKSTCKNTNEESGFSKILEESAFTNTIKKSADINTSKESTFTKINKESACTEQVVSTFLKKARKKLNVIPFGDSTQSKKEKKFKSAKSPSPFKNSLPESNLSSTVKQPYDSKHETRLDNPFPTEEPMDVCSGFFQPKTRQNILMDEFKTSSEATHYNSTLGHCPANEYSPTQNENEKFVPKMSLCSSSLMNDNRFSNNYNISPTCFQSSHSISPDNAAANTKCNFGYASFNSWQPSYPDFYTKNYSESEMNSSRSSDVSSFTPLQNPDPVYSSVVPLSTTPVYPEHSGSYVPSSDARSLLYGNNFSNAECNYEAPNIDAGTQSYSNLDLNYRPSRAGPDFKENSQKIGVSRTSTNESDFGNTYSNFSSNSHLSADQVSLLLNPNEENIYTTL